MANAIIVLLSFIGFGISFYFTGVYYRWFTPNVFWIPSVCRLNEKSCLSVLQTPRAKIFGVPNSIFGIFVYGYLLSGGFFFSPMLGLIFLTFAFGRSVYLAYSLIFATKIPCVLCFCTHVINFILFSFFALRVFCQG